MDEHDLRRLLILAKARLESRAPPSMPPPPGAPAGRLVRCGKAGCTAAPRPYWYAYWTEGGRRRSRYVGKLADTDAAGPRSLGRAGAAT